MRRLLFFASLLWFAGCASDKPQAVAQNTPDETSVATTEAATTQTATAPAPANGPKQLAWTVLQSFPHDRGAFTEGLLWHDGVLYESTGMEKQSSVRKVDLQTGQVLDQKNLADQFFGEGLALAGSKLYQLTWQNKTGFVYDLKSMAPEAKFSFTNEGWGLTYDGKNLVQSDGTAYLTWRNPKDFSAVRRLQVTYNGQPLKNLNELEWINGQVWANVWQTDQIVIIDPQSGKVVDYVDLTGLLPEADRNGNEDVLNGIAYDATNKRLFVTGKYWPKLYWLRVDMPAK